MSCGNGTDRSRTDDLLRVKQALFQLSYDPDARDFNSLGVSKDALFSCVRTARQDEMAWARLGNLRVD